MAYKNLGEFIQELEQQNDLVRISLEVDPELEITEIANRVMKSEGGGKALLFEKVKGSELPLLINALGSQTRMCRALGVQDFREIADRLEALLQPQIPASFLEKVKKIPDLVQLANFTPKTVKSGPCQEIILRGEQASLDILPILKCWPLDGGRYFTFAGVYTRDIETGRRNVGMYRVQKLTAQTCAMHWQVHHDGAAHCRGYEKQQQKMPIALVLGGDPALSYAASAPLPPGMDEILFAGFLRQKPVELVKCLTIDMEVPAEAEIVIEGWADPSDLVVEGPFGDHTGYYSMPEKYPRFQFTAITMRRGAIYPATIVGVPPMEDYYMGLATERIFLPAVRMFLPEILDYHLPAFGVFHNFCLVRLKKEYPFHARKVMHALWGLGQLMFSKFIIVVDEDVNVQNVDEVLFQVGANVDPRRDCCLVDGPVDALDHAAPHLCAGSKMGIDATRKIPGEGILRDWPPALQMPDEIKKYVENRWQLYGI
ncbi:MAG: 3-octaprenyl-4-hydroxybenzoate carboxy-lyase [Planctomycetes bacterium ADurb.Bin412]|nr:MAG: 3-octaprenyl-4-hydroxybenzoate carboxy-lyase [Planctomycetes bacterium ADurb.Bin412]